MSRVALASLLTLATFAGSLAAQDFPVSAKLVSRYVTVYAVENGNARSIIHSFPEHSQIRVNVWEISSSGRWYRITPDGADYHGWVKASNVELQPSNPAQASPSYLATLQRGYKKLYDDTTVTACGIYVGERIGVTRSGLWPGNLARIYRQRDDAVEVKVKYERMWIPRAKIEVHPLLTENHPNAQRSLPRGTGWANYDCQEYYSRNPRKALAIRDGSFHKAASKQFAPVDFYKRGDEISVESLISNAWCSDKEGRWLPTTDVVFLEFPANATAIGVAAVRSGPEPNQPPLASLSSGVQLTLYAFSEGWFRITPEAFSPTGWIAFDQLSIGNTRVSESEVHTAYLDSLRPKPIPPTPTKTAPARRPTSGRQALPSTASFLLGLSVLLLPALSVFTLGQFLLRDTVPGSWYWISYLIQVPLYFLWGKGAAVLSIVLVLLVLGYWLWRVFIHVQYLYGRHPFEAILRRGGKTNVQDMLSFVDQLTSEDPRSTWELRYYTRRREELLRYFTAQEEAIAATMGHARLQDLKDRLRGPKDE